MLKAEPRIGALPMPAAAGQIASLGLDRSVLQSMFLPLTHRVPAGLYTDMSALGAEPQGELAEQSGHWLPVRDLPLKQALRDHASLIEKGFASAYRFIVSEREALLAHDGPLADFERCSIRVVLRDTSLYFRLLRLSIEPSVLRDSIDRMISLERVNHIISICDSAPSFVDMVSREMATLTRLDVPRFLVMTDETDLRDAEGLVAANVMERTPLAEMRLRLERMSETDLERQSKDIRLSLNSHFAAQPGSRSQSLPSEVDLPDTATLIAAANRIGDELLAEVETCGDLPPAWRGLVYISAARRFTVGDAGAGFTDGGLGIAAFLAALFRATGDTKRRIAALDLSLRYLLPITNTAAYNGHIAGGMTIGLGGSLYGAALISSLLDSDEILERGLELAKRLAGRAVAEEREMSLGDGLAGTLL
jgi:lantibiotic modifying enzyme